MLSKDHRLLGEYLAGQMIGHTSPLAIRLFIKGCVFPDHNPWTYLRGVFMWHPFKTHFVFLSYPEIMRLCEKLENRTRLYLWDYYTLGALLHYAADAFTYPHNELFTGSMLEHARYERSELHQTFSRYLSEEFSISTAQADSTASIGECFAKLHSAYMQAEPSARCDSMYICRACTVICARVLEKESILYGKILEKKGYVRT